MEGKKPTKPPCTTHRIALANCPDLTVPLKVTQGEKEDERIWMRSSSLRPLGTAGKHTSTTSFPVPDALFWFGGVFWVWVVCFLGFFFLFLQLCYSLCIDTA